MSMNVKEVQYAQYHGGGNIDSWIAEACRRAGLPQNDHWVKGYKTLCERESSIIPTQSTRLTPMRMANELEMVIH